MIRTITVNNITLKIVCLRDDFNYIEIPKEEVENIKIKNILNEINNQFNCEIISYTKDCCTMKTNVSDTYTERYYYYFKITFNE